MTGIGKLKFISQCRKWVARGQLGPLAIQVTRFAQSNSLGFFVKCFWYETLLLEEMAMNGRFVISV
jgi:hypothetical protein